MNKNKISKQIAYYLRHNPEDMLMDEYGWVSVFDLIKQINITLPELIDIVKSDGKQRYIIKNDKIRASQGHSIPISIEFSIDNSKDFLYHGTATQNVDNIMKNGIKKMNRLYVHLSSDVQTAENVGRRYGESIVFEVNAKQMVEDGLDFKISENGVYLIEFVDSKYLKGVYK